MSTITVKSVKENFTDVSLPLKMIGEPITVLKIVKLSTVTMTSLLMNSALAQDLNLVLKSKLKLLHYSTLWSQEMLISLLMTPSILLLLLPSKLC